MGYADPARVAESVRDGLNCTALVLEQGGRSAAILRFDLCLPSEEIVRRIRQSVYGRTGIPSANVTIAYTQTHTGPNTMPTAPNTGKCSYVSAPERSCRP
jgi:hypothetical protein